MNALRARAANGFYHVAGIFMMLLALMKNRVSGYATPTSIKSSDIDAQVNHTIAIVRSWLDGIKALGLAPSDLAGAKVLELGPGSNLGTGAVLLALGADSYTAYDRFDLVDDNPEYYERLLRKAALEFGIEIDERSILREVREPAKSKRVTYIRDSNFSFAPLIAAADRYSLIVSNATFEHFDDCDHVIGRLSEIATEAAMFVAWVDFKTHSRWIKPRDPNNIYRYGDALYRLFYFPGHPNRLRPKDYIGLLQKYGWIDVKLGPKVTADPSYNRMVDSYMAPRFRGPSSDMNVLSCAVIGRRPRRKV